MSRCKWNEHVWSVRETFDGREVTVCDECGEEARNQEIRWAPR